jgi:hypothetical protein
MERREKYGDCRWTCAPPRLERPDSLGAGLLELTFTRDLALGCSVWQDTPS